MIARPLARRSLWFCGLALDADADDCASDPPHVVLVDRWSFPADACQWSCASSCPQVLRVRSTSCGFYGSVVLPSMPKPMPMLMLMLMIARPLARRACPQGLRVHLPEGLARPIMLMWFCGRFVGAALAISHAVRFVRFAHVTRIPPCRWFLCGSFCGFWSRVVFWCGLARPLARRSCASTCPQFFVDLWSCASTCPQGLRVLWVPLLPKGRARTASVN